MIETVSALAASSRPTPAPTPPSPDGMEIASGPLPQSSPSDTSAFGDAIRVRAAVEEVAASRRTGHADWTALGKGLGSTLSGVASQEKALRQNIDADLTGRGGLFEGGHGTASVDSPPDGVAVTGGAKRDGNFLGEFARLVEQDKTQMRLGLDMANLKIEVEVMSKVSDGVGTSIRHLANGGGGG